MFEECAACGHERNVHYENPNTGLSRCIDCEAVKRECDRFIRTTRGD